jgi:penicillin-binding protein 1A
MGRYKRWHSKKLLNKHRKLLKALIALAVFGMSGFLIIASCIYLYLSPKLPSVDELKRVELQIPLKVYSQDLEIFAEFGEKKRTPVNFSQIPTSMVDAFLAAEDDSFFEHKGIVVSGLARAALELISSGSIRSGGSTITMQVARNFFLSSRQEFTRKFNEILLAFRIEEELTKQEILSLYANKIYMGNRAYGVGAAAQVYYGKTLDQLSLAEIAMIAGLPKAPSKYNPIAKRERALQRRDWILGRMLSLGKINASQYQTAIAEPDTASYHGSISKINAAYAAEMVRQEIIDRFGLQAYTEGYTAVTTIDSKLQAKATQSLQAGIMAYDARHGYRGVEQSMVAEDRWQEVLDQTPTLGGLEPAIVTTAAVDHLMVLLKDGQVQPLNWINGLNGLRLYRSPSARSAPIESALEVFSKGDLIRVTRDRATNSLSLSQLPEAQAAMVAIAPDKGEIRALVGGFDFRQSRFNRITQATRQPGSNFKPFIYTVALNNGFTPASIINDAPVVFDDSKLEDIWRPENDGGKFYGPTRMREALYRSRNLVSIRLLRRMGIDRTLEGLQAFGFNTGDMPSDLSLALGSHALTPLEIARGYATFANGGFLIKPHILDKVIDRDGNIIFQANPETACDSCDLVESETPEPETSAQGIDLQLQELLDKLAEEAVPNAEKDSYQIIQQALENAPPLPIKKAARVVDSQTAFLIDSMLKDVISKGTGRKARSLKRNDIAGKTGTTNGPRDAWFSGYSTHLVATAWVGFDDNSTLGRNEYGGSAALPIWIDFMTEALSDEAQINLPQPSGIVTVKIDTQTGARVAPNLPGIYETFRSQNVPEFTNNGALPATGEDPLPEDLF